jgi:hypothetical protein
MSLDWADTGDKFLSLALNEPVTGNVGYRGWNGHARLADQGLSLTQPGH